MLGNLIRDKGREGRRGYTLPRLDVEETKLDEVLPEKSVRKERPRLAEVDEPTVIRHYTNLSRQNWGIDTNFYPLGSCTMKHNPRANEAAAVVPGFAGLHPLQTEDQAQGALRVMYEVQGFLAEISGLPAVSLQPMAGAQGELTSILMIRKYLEDAGDHGRTTVIVPETAHGTNPATASMANFKAVEVGLDEHGCVAVDELREMVDETTAALMITNPNTCGVFERNMKEISEVLHEAGAFLYMDGANMNANLGRMRAADAGVDIMHFNLHKTFSTPHGGGGPGAGPVVLSERLAPFAPVPFVRVRGKALELVEHAGEAGEGASPTVGASPVGRITAFHGQMGMYVRALAYMLSHGSDGMRQASEDAVLNANYVRASLADLLSLPFGNKPCMHEALFDDAWLKGTGVSTLDVAKAMIDEGFHPMTVYFPLVVHGAMLVEPTESESKASLDLFIAAMRDLAMAAKRGDTERFAGAPYHAPRRRMDETRAARSPILRWTPREPVAEAAE